MLHPIINRMDVVAKTNQNAGMAIGFGGKVVYLSFNHVQPFPDFAQQLQHKLIRIVSHPQPPIVQRAQKCPNTSNFARNATSTTQPSDIGKKTFQPMRISWS